MRRSTATELLSLRVGLGLTAIVGGCSSILAPKAPDSMPRQVQELYEDMRDEGRKRSDKYETGVDVGQGNDKFRFEITIDRHERWESYVRVPSEGITVFQSEEKFEGWTSQSPPIRKPLDDQAARTLYAERIRRVREALEEGTAMPIYQEPLLEWQIVGNNFSIPKPKLFK